MKNKKILIVSHQFLPFVSPRTTRWSLLIDELTKKGNEVTVLTGTAPEELKKNYEVLYFGSKKFSSSINKVRKDSQDSSNNFLKKIIYSILKTIYRFLFKTFSWPDYAMFWAFTIFKNRKRIENKFDIIINATSLGLNSNDEFSSDFSNFKKNMVYIDTIYNPAETKMIKYFKSNKVRTHNGLNMLIYQGQKAFYLWNKINPEVDDELLKLLESKLD